MLFRFLAGVALAFSATIAWADCPHIFVQGTAPTVAKAELICHTNYAIGFRADWEDPAWSAEHLTAARVAEADGFTRKSGGDFHQELLLPKAERVAKADYTGAGYDRGHMAPAADFGADKPECFSMANMVPQTKELNEVIWAGIEDAVRDLATEDGDLYIITGPGIPTTHETIDNGRIAVPTQTWKAIYDPVRGAAAYICENTHVPVCRAESVAKLTQQIGFDPFPALPADVKDTAIALPEPKKGGKLAH